MTIDIAPNANHFNCQYFLLSIGIAFYAHIFHGRRIYPYADIGKGDVMIAVRKCQYRRCKTMRKTQFCSSVPSLNPQLEALKTINLHSWSQAPQAQMLNPRDMYRKQRANPQPKKACAAGLTTLALRGLSKQRQFSGFFNIQA